MKNKIIYLSSVIISLFIGICGTILVVHYIPENDGETKVVEEVVTINESDTIAPAVDKVYDSVVTVLNYGRSLQATGTGFVYKAEDGTAYILTNNHVIESADTVYVTFTNETVVQADVVGSDVYSDIAVLSVDEEYIITVADIGSSEDARLGDTVFAIGAPIDNAYSWSVTRGIVSGKDRLVEVELTSGTTTTPMVVNTIQTDAAINNGNSGGPLANSNGEVIGITSIKLTSETIEGMGFAIPIETAVEYAEQLISGDSVERPYLGIYMLDVSSIYTNPYYYRDYYETVVNAEITNGVIVTDFEANSPAATAGLEVGDIITKVDGHDIRSSAYLRYYLYRHNIGDEITLTILRNGRELTIDVMLIGA